MSADSQNFDHDLDEARARYDAERAKRLRQDGGRKYRQLSNEIPGFTTDHWSAKTNRPSIKTTHEMLIVGGGLGGLQAAVRLQQAGISDFRIIDRAGDFGGTWYWNRYPGAQCDIDSYIYLPFLEETGYIPKEKYAYQPEIFAHAQRIGEQFDLYRRATFQTMITHLEWDEAEQLWCANTDHDDEIRARAVIVCMGPLDRPKIPDFPGYDQYDGHVFHTSRWDYDYTGGDTTGGLQKLRDKRVGVVGTGATGIQCIPFLASDASELFVFQRTPSVVNARGNRPTDPQWVESLSPGWQAHRMNNFDQLTQGSGADEDLVDDGWTEAIRQLSSVHGSHQHKPEDPENRAVMSEIADLRLMEHVRDRVSEIVADEATADALKPWYRYFCKRPTFNDGFLPAFNKPNVTLVDTQGKGIERMTEGGVVASGREYELDCIVFATGFEVGAAVSGGLGYEVVGREGKKLSQHWSDGIRSRFGIFVHGFPNLFMMSALHVGFSNNYTSIVSKLSDHIVSTVRAMSEEGIHSIEPTFEAEEEYCQAVINGNAKIVRFYADCTPGYFNNEGNPNKTGRGLIDSQYAEGIFAWDELVKQWRQSPGFPGMNVTKKDPA